MYVCINSFKTRTRRRRALYVILNEWETVLLVHGSGFSCECVLLSSIPELTEQASWANYQRVSYQKYVVYSVWPFYLAILESCVTISKGEIDCTTRSNHGHPSGSDFSLIGDCGCPRVPRDSLSLSSWGRADQWPVCPLIDDFFSSPSQVNGTSQVSQTERQSSWPYVHHINSS